jgi:hypothetical protein
MAAFRRELVNLGHASPVRSAHRPSAEFRNSAVPWCAQCARKWSRGSDMEIASTPVIEKAAGFDCLRSRNVPENFRRAPRCLARNRRGLPCMRPALKGKSRCNLHGGRSTGPRTAVGLARSRVARLSHGYYSREAADARRQVRERAQVIRGILGLTEAFFMFLPAPKNAAMVQKLGQLQSAFASVFSDLLQNVSRLVADKASQAIDRSPHEAPVRSSVAAAWMRLRPTLRALEVAARRGPGRVRFGHGFQLSLQS